MPRPHWMADLIASSWWPNDGPKFLKPRLVAVDDEEAIAPVAPSSRESLRLRLRAVLGDGRTWSTRDLSNRVCSAESTVNRTLSALTRDGYVELVRAGVGSYPSLWRSKKPLIAQVEAAE
jgi:hypothetical protein